MNFSSEKNTINSEHQIVGRKKIHPAVVGLSILIAFLLLILLKTPSFIIYFELIQTILTLAPMVVILAISFLAFKKQRNHPNSYKGLDYSLLALKLLSAIFIFYLLYSPGDFLSLFQAILSYLSVFLSKEGFLFLITPISFLLIISFICFFLYRLHQKQQGKYNQSLYQLFRRLSFSLLLLLIFIFSGAVFASPKTIKPLTDHLGDVIYTFTAGNVQVFKGTDLTQYKKIKSVKELTQSLSTSLTQTSQSISQTIQESNQQFETQLQTAQDSLSDSISDTTTSLKEKLSEDIDDRLTLSGGSLSGTLTIGKNLTVKGQTTHQDTIHTNDILPNQTNSYSIGSSNNLFQHIYSSNLHTTTLGTDTIDLGTNTIEDQNFTGNWSFNNGILDEIASLTSTSLTAVTANLTTLGFATNTITDGNFSGNWSFNGGNLSSIKELKLSVSSAFLSVGENELFKVNSQGIISQGIWQGTAIVDDHLQSISGSKVSGNISGSASSLTEKLSLTMLDDPTSSTSFSMDDKRLTFTFGNDTSNRNLFNLADSANNLGSGYLLNVSTGDSSLLKPLSVSASNGTFPAIMVNNSGKVGIGNTDPISQLTVVGGATFGLGMSSTLLSDGEVSIESLLGIGTDSPSAPLHIFSENDPQLKISYDASTHFTFRLDSDGNVIFTTSGDSYTFDKEVIANNLTTYKEGDGRQGDFYCQKKEVSTAGQVGDWQNINNDEVCGFNSRCNAGQCVETDFVCGTSQVADADSNVYDTVRIGDQCWMAENLNVGTYVVSNNTGVDHSDVSNNGIIEKYCYNNDTANCNTYGGLYDWNEAMGYVTTAGAQGICPTGWHIPTDAQQHILDDFLKDEGQTCVASRNGLWDCDTAGAKLKANLTGYNGNNSSGFTALLAGYRYTTGTFGCVGSDGYFWSSSESSSSSAWSRSLFSSESRVSRSTNTKIYGFSVRCLKD